MALKFKLLERTLNLQGKKETGVVACSQCNGITSLDEIAERIEKISSLSEGDVRSVLNSLSYIAGRELEAGRIVDLGDIGRLRMSVRSKVAKTKEEFTRANLLTPRIVFTPGRRLREARKLVRFEQLVEGKPNTAEKVKDPHVAENAPTEPEKKTPEEKHTSEND